MTRLRTKTMTLAGVIFLIGLAPLARADQIVAIWNGGDGDWTSATWGYSADPGVVFPNNNGNDTFLVEIDGGNTGVDSNVSLNTNITIDGIRIDAGDQLTITNGRSLALKQTIINDGSIDLASVGSNSFLIIDGAVDYFGAGVVSGANANALITGSGATSVLNIKGNFRLTQGQLNVNVASITNDGEVTVEGGSRLVFQNAAQITNLSGGTLTGGSWIVDGDGSRLDLVGATITTNDAGVLLIGAGSQFAAFDSVTTNNFIIGLLQGRGFNVASPDGFVNNGFLFLEESTFTASSLTNNEVILGTGTINAATTNDDILGVGSLFDFESTPAGFLTFTSGLTLLDGSLLGFTLGGLTRGLDFSAIDVNGSLVLNGLIGVELADDFAIQVGDRFEIIRSFDGLTGAFDINELFASNNPLVRFGVEIESGSVFLTTLAIVPEPASLAMAGLGLVAVAGLVLRRTKPKPGRPRSERSRGLNPARPRLPEAPR